MAKSEPYLIAGAIVVVALCTALTLWAGLGVTWPYAALFALVITAGLIPLARRRRGPVRIDDPEALMRKVEANIAGLARRVEEVERRLADVDQRLVDTSRNTIAALAAELDSVGTVMRGLAEAVALHDAELFAPRGTEPARSPDRPLSHPPAEAAAEPLRSAPQPRRAAPAAPGPTVAAARSAVDAAPADIGSQPAAAVAAPATQAGSPAASPVEVAAVEDALRSGTLELMLQAVVTIPQRKVRLYEAQARVKLFSGRLLDPAKVEAAASEAGLVRELGRAILEDAIRVARHLGLRNRDVPVIIRGGEWLLGDARSFRLLADAVAQDAAFAGRVLIQCPLAVFRDAAALEREVFEAMQSLGLRFVLDEVPDLVLEGRSLALRGVRFVRVPGAVLLAAAQGSVASEIHPADLAGYLSRYGITLIVEEVADEAMSAELFEFEIPLGIGTFFAPSRAVRMEALGEPASPPGAQQQPAMSGVGPAGTDPAFGTADPSKMPDDRSDVEILVDETTATRGRGTPLRAFLRRTSG